MITGTISWFKFAVLVVTNLFVPATLEWVLSPFAGAERAMLERELRPMSMMPRGCPPKTFCGYSEQEWRTAQRLAGKMKLELWTSWKLQADTMAPKGSVCETRAPERVFSRDGIAYMVSGGLFVCRHEPARRGR